VNHFELEMGFMGWVGTLNEKAAALAEENNNIYYI